jgi:hypothetical protein
MILKVKVFVVQFRQYGLPAFQAFATENFQDFGIQYPISSTLNASNFLVSKSPRVPVGIGACTCYWHCAGGVRKLKLIGKLRIRFYNGAKLLVRPAFQSQKS